MSGCARFLPRWWIMCGAACDGTDEVRDGQARKIAAKAMTEAARVKNYPTIPGLSGLHPVRRGPGMGPAVASLVAWSPKDGRSAAWARPAAGSGGPSEARRS